VKNLNPRTAKILLGLMAVIFLAAVFGGNSDKDKVQLVVEGEGGSYVGRVSYTDGPADDRVVHPDESFDERYGNYVVDFKGENITIDAFARRDEYYFPAKRLTISLLDEDGNVIDRDSTLGDELIWVANYEIPEY